MRPGQVMPGHLTGQRQEGEVSDGLGDGGVHHREVTQSKETGVCSLIAIPISLIPTARQISTSSQCLQRSSRSRSTFGYGPTSPFLPLYFLSSLHIRRQLQLDMVKLHTMRKGNMVNLDVYNLTTRITTRTCQCRRIVQRTGQSP